MKKVKVNFVDFWPTFKKDNNYFFNLLSSKYRVTIDTEDPDLLFFSVDYSKRRLRDAYTSHRCKKIFYTGENVRANLDFPGSIEYASYSIGKSDFAFTFDHTPDPRSYRLPLWSLFINWFDIPYTDDRDPAYLIPLNDLMQRQRNKKSKFCNFVFSNSSGERLNILNSIQSYKHVDCAGRLHNNMGTSIPGRGDQHYKVDFLKDYKFTIAAENSSHNGYTTEKIIHPLSVGSIPIYWGSPSVETDFNKDCFINAADFFSFKDLASYVRMVDNDDTLVAQYQEAPVFPNNQIPDSVRPESVLKFFEENILC
jgi:hypothetical protein